MTRPKLTSVRHIVRRLTPVACVAILGLSAAACGSSTKPGTNNAPTATTTPAGPTTPPTTTPATTSPQTGGAGF
jgi:hypothetical protein